MNRALRPEDLTSRWYQSHVCRFGYSIRALGFGHRASQRKRFAALLALGAFHGKRLLDMGCGFGDLLVYLNERGVRPKYTGVDACLPMIERCRRRFAQTEARFIAADAMRYEPDEAFDYVVASGLFGYDAKGARRLVQPTLERLFGMCRIGMGANFLSRCTPRRSPGRVYLYPWDVLEFAFRLTPAVRLDHGYLPNDFTVCLYRRPPWQEEEAS